MKKYNDFLNENYGDRVSIESFLGKTFFSVEQDGDDVINFETIDNDYYTMYHAQDCGEYVTIDDINGDLKDLVGSPILQAKEVTNDTDSMGAYDRIDESFTWTFYKLATAKGYVVIRWFGTSNGCYSERAEIYKIESK